MTLFILTPVSTPPEKEGWYYVSFKGNSMSLDKKKFENGEWQTRFPNAMSQYLKPIESKNDITAESLLQEYMDITSKPVDFSGGIGDTLDRSGYSEWHNKVETFLRTPPVTHYLRPISEEKLRNLFKQHYKYQFQGACFEGTEEEFITNAIKALKDE